MVPLGIGAAGEGTLRKHAAGADSEPEAGPDVVVRALRRELVLPGESRLQPRSFDEGLRRGRSGQQCVVAAQAAAGVGERDGTGSGAIACAIAHALPRAEVLAVEVSAGALAVASRNVRQLSLSTRVHLLAGDLFAPLGSIVASLDLVVANPPYLPTAVLPTLPPEVSRHEPRAALDGGPDGMAVIRRIIAGAPPVLKPGGWLLMEIGDDQAGPVASLMAAEGFAGIRARRDLNGVERYIGGRWEPAVPTLSACASVAARRGGC